MSRAGRLAPVLLLALAVLLLGRPVHAATPQSQGGDPIVPGPCVEGVLPAGALSMVCVPDSGWNGSLLVWAHGYTAFNEPLDFQNLELPDGSYLPELVQDLGFAFATTSYRQNGLAILEGADDVRELVAHFHDAVGEPTHTYMTGASEGGIITTLLAEQSPELFSGGLALCGPTGNFQWQLNYFGDFRILFDHYFPGIIPGDAVEIPAQVIEDFNDVYVPLIEASVAARPVAAIQALRAGNAAHDPNDMSTVENSVVSLLWYNVFATNDGVEKLGGSPFSNRLRWYRRTLNDLQLNRSVPRFIADDVARNNVQPYQTNGNLTIPLVVSHTIGDEIIPIWHALVYRAKANPTGAGRLTMLPINRYGHCEFTTNEVLGAFALLVLQVTGSPLEGVPLPDLDEAARLMAGLEEGAAGD